jgi:membrane-bound ClpP family serine protease
MNGRLIVAIISTIFEELVIALVVLFGLPQIGVNIPLAGLIALMAVWFILSAVIYQLGSRALQKKPLESLPSVVGCEGEVVKPLTPDGLVRIMVRIRGELWSARAISGRIEAGEKVVVLEQDRLKLVVRKAAPGREAWE